ncbi:hypothetical protein M3C00_007625, partial [Micrococcus luteus]|nr:hypothetical protein [Micrococcus luteus]MCV7588286.1 hypothetical protein [Micrococcus luteus]
AGGAGVNPSGPDRRMNQIGAFLKSSLHLDTITSVHVKVPGALGRMNQIGAFWNSSLHLDRIKLARF